MACLVMPIWLGMPFSEMACHHAKPNWHAVGMPNGFMTATLLHTNKKTVRTSILGL